MILLVALAGCVTLDWAVFNGVPCADVGPATCAEVAEPWDQLCVPCAEPYPWDRAYDWMPGTLAPDATVRPIDPNAVVPLRWPSDDGLAVLDAYYVPAHGDNPALGAITVLYNHGNYGSIEHYLPRVRFLHEAGYGVIVWDYRGYGKTDAPGTPTPDQHLADARRVAERSRALLGDDAPLVPYGYSLGAITAIEQALALESCALVLEAPFTGLDNVVRGNTGTAYPSRFLYDGQYETDERIAEVRAPLLVMSGDLDGNFPPEDVGQLVAAAGGPARWWRLPDARHGVSDGGVPEAGLDAYFAEMSAHLSANCAR